MVQVKYSLEEFIHDMTKLVEEQPDQEKLFDVGSSHLERLVTNPDAIPEEYRRPIATTGPRAGRGSYVLYKGESGLLITSVVWGAGTHIGPHDHKTWGMIGIMDNVLTETRFKRKDDGESDEYATLEKDRVNTALPGDISLLIPNVDEIHQMDNFTDRSTTEIHVYGDDLRGLDRCSYNLESGKITHFATQKFDNC